MLSLQCAMTSPEVGHHERQEVAQTGYRCCPVTSLTATSDLSGCRRAGLPPQPCAQTSSRAIDREPDLLSHRAAAAGSTGLYAAGAACLRSGGQTRRSRHGETIADD